LDGAQCVLYTGFQRVSIPLLIVLRKEQRKLERISFEYGRG
jgi:hypothetical protein